MPTKPRFKTCVLAVAFAAMPLFAEAAGLGRLNVFSGLGQPFKGEIDLVAVQANEVETLKVGLASADVYSAAQLSYPSPSLGLRLSLSKRANGQYFVQLSSVGAIDEPVFNVLVDLSWQDGRIQREYTALIDPVGYASGSIATTPAPEVRVASESPVAPAPQVSSVITSPKAQTATVTSKKVQVPAAQPASAPAAEGDHDYTVKSGDTLSLIAGKVKPEGVSLDQVLVGLYRSNQSAFDGNMNRLKRGKILRVPTASDLAAVTKAEATKEIKAQAANWQNYRRQLAEATGKGPAADVAGETSSGRIKAKVEDKGAQVVDKNKDVLKLSRGASKVDDQKNRVRALEEEGAARKKALDEANQRVAELQKNIREMEKLAALKNKTGAELQQKAETVKASVPPAAVVPAKSVIASVPAAPVLASAPAPVVVASAVVATPTSNAAKDKPKRVMPPPAPVVEPEVGIVDMLMDNALAVGGGLTAALLAIVGLLWSRNRRRPSVFENSLITSGDLKPNTVLGRTGGGVISTQAENSFLTDFSRQGLGTIDTDEVDPIAEADVYMAYGRNAQAEEILKDALVKDPHRQEIRMKLLEIFVARKDKTAFEEVAADLYAATGGVGPHWEQALYLGRSIDPENPLYARKGETVEPSLSAAPATVVAAASIVAVAATGLDDLHDDEVELQSFAAALEDEGVLDFEFELPGAEPELPAPSAETLPEVSDDLGFDLDLGGDEPNAVVPEVPVAAEEVEEVDLSFDLSVPQDEQQPEEDALMSLDLPIDLGQDFSIEVDLAAQEKVDAPVSVSPNLDVPDFNVSTLGMPDLDLNLDLESMPSVEEADAEAQAIADFSAQLSEMEASSLDEPESLAMPQPVSEGKIDLDFDFNVDAVHTEIESLITPIDLDLEMGAGSAENMDFTADDPVQTKIDLARAYIDMGDVEGAREILQEAEQEGSALQQDQARSLLANL